MRYKKLWFRGALILAVTLTILPFQNCGEGMAPVDFSSSSDAKLDKQEPGQIPSSSIRKISIPSPGSSYEADPFEASLSILPSGDVVDAEGRTLSLAEELRTEAAAIIADSLVCEVKLPPDTMACMAYTAPFARAESANGQTFDLTHNPICAQNRFDLCGDVSERLIRLIERIHAN